MSTRAEILIEDADTGGASVRFVFPEGFNPKSAAHQLAQIIQAQLDAMCADGALVPLSERVDHNGQPIAGIEALPVEADPVALVNASPIVR